MTTMLPFASARHWVSTCRGFSRYFSTKHSPRPKAARASRVADSNCSGISSIVCATLRPRPPPPWAAFIATGTPCCFANSTISSAEVTGSAEPGAKGAPTLWAIWRAETLSPSKRIAAGGGPIQIKPASITICAKSAFSERNPYPGWIAFAPDRFAIARIFSGTK